MNETSLGVLLERARHAFNTTNHNTSDHDSGVTAGEVTPPVMSPIVQSYIAGLQTHPHGKFYVSKTFKCEGVKINIFLNEE